MRAERQKKEAPAAKRESCLRERELVKEVEKGGPAAAGVGSDMVGRKGRCCRKVMPLAAMGATRTI